MAITVDHELVHESGVFFDLPEAEYHAALGLSASGIKSLRVSALDWYMRSPLNPEYEPEPPTDGMAYGTAAHARVLMGREWFYEHYAAALDPDDYPDAVRTNEQLANAILYAGGPKPRSNMRKSELVEMLRSFSPEAQIWEELASNHGRVNAGKTLLSQRTLDHIEIAAAHIERHPDLGRAFRDGAPEVSIFWRDEATGVPCKARCDYIKPKLVCDLKTFGNPYGMTIERAVYRAMANYKYMTQAAWYLDAAAQIADGPYAGEKSFMFIFQQQGVAPVATGWLLDGGIVFDVARQEVEQAKLTWARCWDQYGTLPWVDVSPIRTFEDSLFPAYATTDY